MSKRLEEGTYAVPFGEILACVVSAPAFAQQYTISTYAGGGDMGLEVVVRR